MKAQLRCDISLAVSIVRNLLFICASLVVPSSANAQTLSIGHEVVIRKSYENSSETSDGSSSGSSRGSDSILQRLVATREGGVEFIYDLPKSASKEDRARSWQFPAHVFQPNQGSLELLNKGELESRLATWLKSAGWDRSVCGRWIFTWNAFRIECDPQSVIESINAFDLRVSELREGTLYSDSNATEPRALVRKPSEAGTTKFIAEFTVNPDAVRRARAQSDVAVGEIIRKPVLPEAALRERMKEEVSGTTSITLEAGDEGQVRRRIRVTRLKTKRSDGSTETEISTETVERL